MTLAYYQRRYAITTTNEGEREMWRRKIIALGGTPNPDAPVLVEPDPAVEGSLFDMESRSGRVNL